MKTSILAILLLLIYGTACKTVKSLQTAQKATSEQTEVQAIEKTQTETKTDGKTKTVITEKAEGTLVLEGQELVGRSTDLKNEPIILGGDGWTTVVTDSAGTTKAKTVIRSKKIPFQVDKRTEKEESLQQTKTVKQDSTGVLKEKFKQEEKTKNKNVTRSVGLPWWIWLILLVIALYLGWRFRARIKSLLP